MSAAAVILIAAAILTVTLTPFGAATSPDSLDYFDVAEDIRSSKEVALPWHKPEAVDEWLWQLHPPLYPLALSLFLTADEPPERSAASMALWTLAISALLIFELLRPAIGPRAALLGALAFMISQPTLTVFTFAWSESLAVPLLLLSSWCCLRCVSAAGGGRPRELTLFLILLMVSIGMLAYTRLIGIVFVVLLPLVWWLAGWRRIRVGYILASAALAVPVGILLRDHQVVGRLTRGLSTSPVDNARDALVAFSLQFATRPEFVLVAGLVSIVGLWLGLRIGRSVDRPKSTDAGKQSTQLGWVCLCIVTTYLVGMVAARTLVGFGDRLDTRLIAPGFAFLIVLLFLGCFRIWKLARPSRWNIALAASCAVMILLSSAQGVSTYSRALAREFAAGSSSFPMMAEHQTYNDFTPPSDPRGACIALLMRANFLITMRLDNEKGIAYGQKALGICKNRRQIRKWLGDAFLEWGEKQLPDADA